MIQRNTGPDDDEAGYQKGQGDGVEGIQEKNDNSRNVIFAVSTFESVLIFYVFKNKSKSTRMPPFKETKS